MNAPSAADKEVPAGGTAAGGPTAVVVGGGPAGLRAAETLAADGGCAVTLYEQKPSVGRKFLVAGQGGLNLTHSEALPDFIARYYTETARWQALLEAFGPTELRAWAAGLGVDTYVGTSGRVFPRGQQAATLLRRWVARLRTMRVDLRVHQRLESLLPDAHGGWALGFRDVRTEARSSAHASVVVLALGGASWPQTGSDGTWPLLFPTLDAGGPLVHPWQAANCGWGVAWDPRLLAVAEGQPLKNIRLSAGDQCVDGEALITRYGLEGGAVYQLGRALRAMAGGPVLHIDLKPEVPEERLLARLSSAGGVAGATGAPDWECIARRLKLGVAARALLEFHGETVAASGGFDPPALAATVKGLRLPLTGPRPVAEAISSAGGVDWHELDDDLMLRRLPGVYLAGEMIDWEAPTGGYLLQGCFATGTRAGAAARRHALGSYGAVDPR